MFLRFSATDDSEKRILYFYRLTPLFSRYIAQYGTARMLNQLSQQSKCLKVVFLQFANQPTGVTTT